MARPQQCVKSYTTIRSIPSRALKPSASSVLAPFRGSTYDSEYDSLLHLLRALPASLFDHPAGCYYGICDISQTGLEVWNVLLTNLVGLESRHES